VVLSLAALIAISADQEMGGVAQVILVPPGDHAVKRSESLLLNFPALRSNRVEMIPVPQLARAKVFCDRANSLANIVAGQLQRRLVVTDRG